MHARGIVQPPIQGFLESSGLAICTSHMLHAPDTTWNVAGSVMQREPPSEASGKKFFIHTFGCQMNLADSERMAGALEANGFSCTEEASEAEVLIYNTCSIRQKAENKVCLLRVQRSASTDIQSIRLLSTIVCVLHSIGAAL